MQTHRHIVTTSSHQTKDVRGASSLLLLPVNINLFTQETLNRDKVESYISSCFYNSYQANISLFLEFLLTSQTDQNLISALGFQGAANRTLFLEQYLNTSVEQSIADRMKARLTNTPRRQEIAEIGNLASTKRGSSQMLFILITALLTQAGYDWVVFTATRQVRSILHKLRLSTFPLAEASADKLHLNADSWGSYYQHQPLVVAGYLPPAMAYLSQHPVMGKLLQHYQQDIVKILDQIG